MLDKFSDMVQEPAERIRVIWEELKTMDEANFRFAEKEPPAEFASSIASSMQRCYPPDWVLSAAHLLREVDPLCPGNRTN
jgi:secreted Zn-dependent insulinase-like peptidase